MVVVGGISITSPILANVKYLIFNGRYKGVQTAIENGYEQNIDGIYSESNGIRLEVIKVVSDPTMINLKFKVSSNDINNIKEFKYAQDGPSINYFNITDDKDRVIQFYDEEDIGSKPIIDENGIEYRTDRPGSMEINNGKYLVEITFEASKFHNLEKFKFVIEDLNGKDEVVKLTKEVK